MAERARGKSKRPRRSTVARAAVTDSAERPAVYIRTLEREIGVTLIARVGRTVSVTEEGSRILQRSRDLLRNVADLRSVANEDGVSGELRLGACPTALAGMLPDVLARMVETFPQINVFIRPGYSADLYRAVEAGDLDAVRPGPLAPLLIAMLTEASLAIARASEPAATHQISMCKMPVTGTTYIGSCVTK